MIGLFFLLQFVTLDELVQLEACLEVDELVFVSQLNPQVTEAATFRVCKRDLEQLPGSNFPDGWDPNAASAWRSSSETTGDLDWLGGPVSSDRYREDFDGDGCLTFVGTDDNNCDIEQTLCIELVGTSCENAEVYEMFMFDCQFYEFDDDAVKAMEYHPYHWEWSRDNNDDNDPFLEYDADGTQCERINYSSAINGSWGDQDFCDTIIKPLIRIVHVDSTLVQGDSTAQGTPWTFGLCIDNDCDYLSIGSDWPVIDMGYEIEWINCDTGDPIFRGDTYVVTSKVFICAKAIYSFNDGAWGGDNPFNSGVIRSTSCEWIYGPMILTPYKAITLELTCVQSSPTSLIVSWEETSSAIYYNVYMDDSFVSSTAELQFAFEELESDSCVDIKVEAILSSECPAVKGEKEFCTSQVDADGDGSPLGTDCDDADANNFPGNQEVCDGVDNNCNNQIDEGIAFTNYYIDVDEDTYGSDDSVINDCRQPDGYVSNAEDCDDTNPNINPGIEEIPGNGIDEDCDGMDEPSVVYELSGTRVSIYPNPVKSLLCISYVDNMETEVTLLDTSGKVIISESNSREINVSGLVEGTYLLKIKNVKTNQEIVERVVVIR